MNPVIIYAFAGVMGASVLLCIPFMIMNSKKKKKAAAFIEMNKDKAILHVYGENVVIDGVKVSKMENVMRRGENLEPVVPLTQGKHTISAKYGESSVNGFGKNVNYKTPKPIESEIELEAGHEYTISIYFYSPEERESYYKGDVGETVFCQELDVKGGGYSKAYIICYKEK